MAEKEKSEPKTLEMRVAELEDKLQKVHVTEEEMQAYNKVASLMGGRAAGGTTGGTASLPADCVIAQCTIVSAMHSPVHDRQPMHSPVHDRQPMHDLQLQRMHQRMRWRVRRWRRRGWRIRNARRLTSAGTLRVLQGRAA